MMKPKTPRTPTYDYHRIRYSAIHYWNLYNFLASSSKLTNLQSLTFHIVQMKNHIELINQIKFWVEVVYIFDDLLKINGDVRTS